MFSPSYQLVPLMRVRSPDVTDDEAMFVFLSPATILPNLTARIRFILGVFFSVYPASIRVPVGRHSCHTALAIASNLGCDTPVINGYIRSCACRRLVCQPRPLVILFGLSSQAPSNPSTTPQNLCPFHSGGPNHAGGLNVFCNNLYYL
jgi:hypothetical protein